MASFSTLNSFSSLSGNGVSQLSITPPSAPTNLTWDTTNTTTSSIAVNFTAPSGATSYTPYINGVAGTGSGIPSLYLISVPTANTNYSISLVANNSSGSSGASSSINATTQIATPSIQYLSSGATTITFSMNIVGTATTAYNVYVNNNYTTNGSLLGNNMTVAGLNYGSGYSIYLTIGNGYYTSSVSNTIGASTAALSYSYSGGSISTVGNYVYIQFTGVGSNTGAFICNNANLRLGYIVVGGGGSGGGIGSSAVTPYSNYGGQGGCGGQIWYSGVTNSGLYCNSGTTYYASVGGGGVGTNPGQTNNGYAGGGSSFSSIYSGGGAGGYRPLAAGTTSAAQYGTVGSGKGSSAWAGNGGIDGPTISFSEIGWTNTMAGGGGSYVSSSGTSTYGGGAGGGGGQASNAYFFGSGGGGSNRGAGNTTVGSGYQGYVMIYFNTVTPM